MCGRFTLISDATIIAEIFQLLEVPDLDPRYNIAPTQFAPVVRFDSRGAGRRVDALRWGLIPSWAEDPAIGSRMINARAETVATKPSFRSAFRRQRCLVVTDGYYEWQKLERGKQPYYIRMVDEQPFAFAGLWERRQGADADPIESFTIITTQPNDRMSAIHDRMPVILDRTDYATWLDPSEDNMDRLQSLLCPYASERMTAYKVSTQVNKPANDSAECVQRLDLFDE